MARVDKNVLKITCGMPDAKTFGRSLRKLNRKYLLVLNPDSYQAHNSS